MTADNVAVTPFGERGLLATLRAYDDPVSSGAAANAIADDMRRQRGVDDAVAGIDSVAIRFDPRHITYDDAAALMTQSIERARSAPRADTSRIIDIPVSYGGVHGPDFDDVCALCNVDGETLIARHSQSEHCVATLGFAPGFAYIGGLDARLHVTRLERPRRRVAAGSVGLAGGLTGLYPLSSPGGWRIIGRTPIALFRPHTNPMFLLKPGDRVRFSPISEARFADSAGAP